MLNDMDPLVSVIVRCRGHARELRRCLASIVMQESVDDFEVIVVVAAADEDVAGVVAACPEVRLVRSREGLPPGLARNLGVAHARGSILLFVDADCTCEPGWLAAAAAALKGGWRLVGGAVLDGRPWHPIGVTDNLLQFSDLSAHRSRGPIRLVASCNLGIERRAFDAIDGFRPVAVGADVLFCAAAARQWPNSLLFEPRMRVRHFGRTSLCAFWRHQELFGRARGALGLELSPSQQRAGRFAVVAPAVWLKRLLYPAAARCRIRPCYSHLGARAAAGTLARSRGLVCRVPARLPAGCCPSAARYGVVTDG
jgi:glycosyltransferase involved in cell wall biosynthesis